MKKELTNSALSFDDTDRKVRIMLNRIELALEKKVISDIRERQKKIPGLKQDPLKYLAYWGNGKLATGCRECCLKGKWTLIRTTSRCNAACNFCYYYQGQGVPHALEELPKGVFGIVLPDKMYDERDIRLFFETRGNKFINGVAWLYYEPLLEMDKVLSLMEYLAKKGYYQWLYTNGILATEEKLKRLRDAGLNEIRFNIAATNCSTRVLEHMKTARKYFKTLCIESPMYTGFFDSFIKKRREILDTGVDHIHFAELHLFSATIDNFKSEGPIYRYKQGYISPIKSRQLTYDIFDIAEKEKWNNVVLYDCSNEVKFYRGVKNGIGKFHSIDYRRDMELPESFYEEALRRDDLEWD